MQYRITTLTAILLCCWSASAATFYVDYDGGSDANAGTKVSPWKLSPGMPGFAGSYSHTAGDTIIFKGGVTWPSNSLPLVPSSGSSISVRDSYGGYDQTWYSGGSWSRPVFAQNEGVDLTGISFVKIGWLMFSNSAAPGVGGHNSAIYAFNADGYRIENCLFSIDGPFGILAPLSKSVASISIVSNIFTLCSHAAYYDIDSGFVINGMDMSYNEMSNATTNYGAYHPDGFQFNFATGYPFQNFTFHNNRFYGDWKDGATAYVWVYGWTNGMIYNNVFTYDNTNDIGDYNLNAPVYGGDCKDIRIFNNTFSSDANTNASRGFRWCIWLQNAITNVWIYNNIFSGFEKGIALDAAGSITFSNVNIDHNIYTQPGWMYGYVGPNNWNSWAQWQAAGFEANGITTNSINFTTYPNGAVNGDLRLLATSPAIGIATNLDSYFTTDYLGNTRGTVWDMGAYEYAAPAASRIIRATTLRVGNINP